MGRRIRRFGSDRADGAFCWRIPQLITRSNAGFVAGDFVTGVVSVLGDLLESMLRDIEVSRTAANFYPAMEG